MLELYQEPLLKIPIPLLDTPEKCEIAGQIEVLVGKILSMKTEVEKSSLEKGCEPSERGVSELKTPSANKVATFLTGRTEYDEFGKSD